MLSLRSNRNQTRQPTNSCLASLRLATCQTVHVLSILTVEFFFCAVTAALHACVGPSVYCVMYHFDLPTHAKCKNQIQPGPTIETILLSSRSNCKVHTMKHSLWTHPSKLSPSTKKLVHTIVQWTTILPVKST